MRDHGRITDWNDDKGFGFVTPTNGGPRTFVHIKAFSYRPRRPHKGDVITYQLAWDAEGRPRAENILFHGVRPPSPATSRTAVTQYILAVIALAATGGLALLNKISWVIPLAYVSVSLLLFCVYAFDKSAAVGGRQRISESSLHLLSMLGGWPGALVAQALFRHKTRKTSFRVVFFLIVIIHVALLASLALEVQHPLLESPLFKWMLGH